MSGTSAAIREIQKLESELSVAQLKIAMLKKSGKDLIDYIWTLELDNKPPSKSQREQVIKAIRVIWNIL
jgi:hypothetical protein